MCQAIRIEYQYKNNEPVSDFKSFRDSFDGILKEISGYIKKSERVDSENIYIATIRYKDSEDIETVLDGLENLLSDVSGWYCLKTHPCRLHGNHDHCEPWTVQRTYGDVST